VLNEQTRRHGVFVFHVSPGLVRTDMTKGVFPENSLVDDARVRGPAPVCDREGRLDRLVGRYLHAERDPVDELERRADEIIAEDLNVIRLRRK
jgi:3-oxoacyl-[acyl-carrier protein] reductase